MSFCHLHLHDEFSLLDGLGSPEQYIKKAKELGFAHLAITNHGNIDSAIKFQDCADKEGLKAILGAELYIVPNLDIKEKGEKRRHITVLIKDQIGWENINKMLTVAHLQGFYYKPRISPELLLHNCAGLVVMTACASSFLLEDWGIDLLKSLKQKKVPLFAEIMPHNYKEQLVINKLAAGIAAEMGIKTVATNDCHYISAGDEKAHEVLLAIQTKKTWNDPGRWKFDIKGLHVRTEEEMIKAFAVQKQFSPEYCQTAINNTMLVADLCSQFKIESKQVNLPEIVCGFEDEETMTDAEKLVELCELGFQDKILEHPIKKKQAKQYRQRLQEELEIIIRQKFDRYFLIIWELMDWCRSNDIMVGPGRGSSAGSLVCYLLKITVADPIEHNLLFARFISPARIDLPDIDMDFEDIKRPLIWKHFKELYGENNVAGVSTFGYMHGKGSLRDVSRVFQVPVLDVNAASNCIVVRSGGDFRSDFTLVDAFETFEDGRKFKAKYPEETKIAIRLEGQARSRGQHAAAIVISKDDLTAGNRGYLLKGNKGEAVINWEKTDIEYMGLMKLDVLGLSSLTVISEANKLIKQKTGQLIDFENMALDDPKIYSQFSAGNTVGIFQFGSLGLRKFCKEMGIDSFEMLTHTNALFRPGTLRSGMTTQFVLRKKGETNWEYKHPMLEAMTKDTYGIILYQEQVMQFMYDLGGLGWKTADTVRKVISKSQGVEQFMKFKELFAQGCVDRKTLDRQTAESLWDELASFGCLSGDTKIYRSSPNQYSGREMTIREAFVYQSNTNFKHRKLKIMAMHEDGQVRDNTINRIVYTGKKELFEIITETGKKIEASGNHRFLINETAWKNVANTKVGDTITTTDFALPVRNYITTGTGSGAHNHDRSLYTIEENKQKEKLIRLYGRRCQDCSSKKHIEMHHFDGNHRNNSDENTRLLCKQCHRSGKYHPAELFHRLRRGYVTQQEKIISIKSVGLKDCYDIEMTGEPRNFIANCFISHNSYGFNRSHACVYSMIAYWQMHLKLYHPLEFFCASLTYGSEAKKEDLVEEAIRMGVEVRPPKVGKSHAKAWVTENNILYCPFIEIKGIGESTADKLEQQARTEAKKVATGFFKKKFNRLSPAPTESRIKESKPISKKFKNILDSIKASEDRPITEDEATELDSVFSFSFSKDPQKKFRKLITRITESLCFDKLSTIDHGAVDKTMRYYFGQMTEIKFGYRGKIDTLEKKQGLSGTADSLGGVYGNFKDDSDFCMLTFNGELYTRRKDAVEHCAEEFLIAKANHPFRTSSIQCNDAWFSTDLLGCNLSGLGINLIRRRKFINKEFGDSLTSCADCELRAQCKAPVLPSAGRYNIMIVGEAPGSEEDRAGMGFYGRSGEMIWSYLERENLERRVFHITNINKCFPKDSRTPNKKQIKSCSKWIEKEISELHPAVILAFGNTCLEYFKGQESGIMDLSGVTEWSDKANAWICWCLHPAAVLYHRENMTLFEKGMDNFVRCIIELGDIPE